MVSLSLTNVFTGVAAALGYQAFRAASAGADAAQALADIPRGEGLVRQVRETVTDGVGRVTQLLVPPQAALVRGMISDEKWSEMILVMERIVGAIDSHEMPVDADMELVVEFIELLIPSLKETHVPGSPFDIITDNVPAECTAGLKELHKALKEATGYSKGEQQHVLIREVAAVSRSWKGALEARSASSPTPRLQALPWRTLNSSFPGSPLRIGTIPMSLSTSPSFGFARPLSAQILAQGPDGTDSLIGVVANSSLSLRDIVEFKNQSRLGLLSNGIAQGDIEQMIACAKEARIREVCNKRGVYQKGLRALRQTSSCYRRLLKQASPVLAELVGAFALLAKKTAFTSAEHAVIVRAQNLAQELLTTERAADGVVLEGDDAFSDVSSIAGDLQAMPVFNLPAGARLFGNAFEGAVAVEDQLNLPRGVTVREADLDEFRAALQALSACTFNENPQRSVLPWTPREAVSFSRHLGAIERVRSLNEGRIAGAVRQMTYGALDPINAGIDDVERRVEDVKTMVADIPGALVEGITHPGFVAGALAIAFMISGIASAVMGFGTVTFVSHFACAGAISLGLYAYKHGILDTHLRPVANQVTRSGLAAMRSVNRAWASVQERFSSVF
jgi:hypothetical protein